MLLELGGGLVDMPSDWVSKELEGGGGTKKSRGLSNKNSKSVILPFRG